ncbi:MAG: hypothetical protein CM1200mP22_26630 [Dehalococcoidia bacterium]|nr:MAG: hypothetical protein CM1200mP22_26630 [Dehalococcoidia bacterium]
MTKEDKGQLIEELESLREQVAAFNDRTHSWWFKEVVRDKSRATFFFDGVLFFD